MLKGLAVQSADTDQNTMIKEVDRYLRADSAVGRIVVHAQLLARLGQRLAAALPGPLAASARLANFRNGRAVILADNGAVATKVRQMSQRLAGELSKAGVDCDGVDVRVQPREAAREIAPGTVKPLSVKSFESLRSTAESLPKGPLKAALDQLLARVAKSE